MQREYLDHWEERLPRAEKPETYKKLGLPLVLMPFVLMFCGGCVATAPTASILIAALAGLMWFGDVVIEANKSQRYYVTYAKQPRWKVGETSEEAGARRKRISVVEDAERYPNDYAGRIQTVKLVSESSISGCVGDMVGCTELSLTLAQVKECWRRNLKVVNDQLVATTATDKWGAVTAELKTKYTDAQLMAHNVAEDVEQGSLRKMASEIQRSLAKTVSHTGTGLYSVKAAPTNETEEQDGAVAGQVVTIVGTVAASPAFTGGYITNSTQAETRAIVSHDTTTATMEGDISGWGTGDTLEFYDSWDAVQDACDQLYIDQGPGDFTLTQEVRLYAGTYTEAVIMSSMTPSSQFRLNFTANSGDSPVISNSGTGDNGLWTYPTDHVGVFDIDFTSASNGDHGLVTASDASTIVGCNFTGTGSGNGERGIWGRRQYLEDCTFTDLFVGQWGEDFGWVSRRCRFTDCEYGHYSSGATPTTLEFTACVFDTCDYGVNTTQSEGRPGLDYQLRFINCTAYACGRVYWMFSDTNSNGMTLTVYNCIFSTNTTVWYGDAATAELSRVRAEYNTYYNNTQIAYLGGSNVDLATWQALTDFDGNSPDATSIATDPGLTSPATGDMSLTAASNCRHAGVGS